MAEVKNNKIKSLRKKISNKKLPIWGISLIVFISIAITVAYLIFIGALAYLTRDDKGDGYYDVTKNFEVVSIDKDYYDKNNKEYVIEGVIANKTFKKYDDVEIEYYLYDENNSIISIARSYIDDVDSKESVQFKATSDDDVSKISNYKLIKVVEDTNYYNSKSMYVDPIDYDE